MNKSIEKAFEESWLNDYYHGNYKGHAQVGFYAGAEWQAKQSLWVSVEDKLPEENTGVLFLVEWGKNHYGYFVGVYYGNGCWESDHRVFLPDSKIGKVTYWMPLPKKGDEI